MPIALFYIWFLFLMWSAYDSNLLMILKSIQRIKWWKASMSGLICFFLFFHLKIASLWYVYKNMKHLVDSRNNFFSESWLRNSWEYWELLFFNSRGGGRYLTQTPAAAALLFARHATLPSQMINHHLIISVLGKAGTTRQSDVTN